MTHGCAGRCVLSRKALGLGGGDDRWVSDTRALNCGHVLRRLPRSGTIASTHPTCTVESALSRGKRRG